MRERCGNNAGHKRRVLRNLESDPQLFTNLKELIERIFKHQLLELCEASKLRHAARISLSHAGAVSRASVRE